MPNKTKEGRFEDIIPCIYCEGCYQDFMNFWPVECTVNFLCGREYKYKIKKTDEPKKVVIVGGGPAGPRSSQSGDLDRSPSGIV